MVLTKTPIEKPCHLDCFEVTINSGKDSGPVISTELYRETTGMN